MEVRLGIIGGTSLYKMDRLSEVVEKNISTPYGNPSGPITLGRMEEYQVAFLPRHGIGHQLLPSEINYAANIYALKSVGVEWIVSLSSVGSLKEEIKPGDIVIVDQYVDRTNKARKQTLFGDGVAAHVSLADPICPTLAKRVYQVAIDLGISAHMGGTYVNVEGPPFSTRAESDLYRKWGMDLVGMTNYSEARVAREAEICYITVALVTDYDCWYEHGDDVNVEMVLEFLKKNEKTAQLLLREVAKCAPFDRTQCTCPKALENAIVTDLEKIPLKKKEELSVIIGKYVNLID
jgi:5'-methylthioadenosine phosphorylase